MILTKKPNTDKQRKEFSLLVSIRFACLMSVSDSPMQDARVQSRLEKLKKYLLTENCTHTFACQYLGRSGELGNSFCLSVCPQTYAVNVARVTDINVLPLIA